MSHLRLVKCIIEKLRTDTGVGSLVALTLHSSGDIRIARDRPPVKGKLPFLGVRVIQSIPLIGSDATHVKRSRVHFRCYSTSEIVANQIADRLDVLLDDKEGITSYYDFSGTDLSCRSGRWKSRDETDFDEETDAWNVLVEADVIWTPQQCPVAP